MPFDTVKKELGGKVLAMPQHSTVYQFARAMGATPSEAAATVRERNKLPAEEQLLAQGRMAKFLARRAGPREAIRRMVAAGGHAYAAGGKIGCAGCSKPIEACQCAISADDGGAA